MAFYARLEQNIVVEIIEQDKDPVKTFHKSLKFLACAAAVKVGWQYADEVFSPPAPPPSPTKSELKQYLSAQRWEKEVGGIIVDEMKIPTDDRAKILLEGASRLDPTVIVKFKMGESWIDLTGAQMSNIYSLVTEHVRICYQREALISEKIDLGEVITFSQITEQLNV